MLAMIAKILTFCKVEALYIGTSNPATDVMAFLINAMYPELAVVRLHQTNGELRALRRTEEDLIKQMSSAKDPLAPNFIDRTLQFGSCLAEFIGLDDKDPVAYNEALPEQYRQMRGTSEWRSKKQRPNYTTLGLNVRTLQNAGLISHDLEPFKNTGDQHKEFCEMHKAAAWKSDLTPEQLTKYKDAEKLAAIDTIRKSRCVVTTPSQTSDKLLLEAKKPLYVIHDEVCQATDVTTL